MTSTRLQLAPLDDFELANSVCKSIDSRYSYERLMRWESDLPIDSRIIYFAWTSIGYASCEGYAAYLCMTCEHWELAFSLREIGLAGLALLVEQMLSPIPRQGILGNTEALERHFGGWDNLASWVSPFESKLFDDNNRIVSAVAKYCRAHKADLIQQLGPKIEKLFIQGGAQH